MPCGRPWPPARRIVPGGRGRAWPSRCGRGGSRTGSGCSPWQRGRPSPGTAPWWRWTAWRCPTGPLSAMCSWGSPTGDSAGAKSSSGPPWPMPGSWAGPGSTFAPTTWACTRSTGSERSARPRPPGTRQRPRPSSSRRRGQGRAGLPASPCGWESVKKGPPFGGPFFIRAYASSPERALWMAWAAVLPAPMAKITVAAPVTASPPA